jgi:hypothetical protein
MTGPEMPVANMTGRPLPVSAALKLNQPLRDEAKSDFEQCQTTKGKMLGDDDDDDTRFNYVVKLGNYDGTSSLETFLAKLQKSTAVAVKTRSLKKDAR